MQKQPNESLFNFLSNDIVYFHGHAKHRNGRNVLSKKNRPQKKVVRLCYEYPGIVWIGQLFWEVKFFWKAISTISMTCMATNVYSVGKEIEQAFIWFFFQFSSSNRSREIAISKAVHFWQLLFWVAFFRRTILTISMAPMAMKVYMVVKEIEWAFIWLLFNCYILSSSWDIVLWK